RLPSGKYQSVTSEAWPKTVATSPELEVTLQEDLNTPPKLYVVNSKTKEKALLLDLNPQFSALNFGKVQSVEWAVEGIELIGGLYLPADYTPGRRYPLVIQTHGFLPKQFSMDGRSEWSSGFAARQLAANGIVVLQAQDFKNPKDHDRVGLN